MTRCFESPDNQAVNVKPGAGKQEWGCGQQLVAKKLMGIVKLTSSTKVALKGSQLKVTLCSRMKYLVTEEQGCPVTEVKKLSAVPFGYSLKGLNMRNRVIERNSWTDFCFFGAALSYFRKLQFTLVILLCCSFTLQVIAFPALHFSQNFIPFFGTSLQAHWCSTSSVKNNFLLLF